MLYLCKKKIKDMRDIKTEMVTIGNKIEELKNELNNLKQERLSECDFSVGELVDIYEAPFYKDDEEKHKGRGYIFSIGVNDKGDFVYKFNKVKKDGTMSGHSFYVYGRPRIEKIKENLRVFNR